MGKVSSMLPISLLYPKESFTSNFKTERIFLLKRFFEQNNFQSIPTCYISKSYFLNLSGHPNLWAVTHAVSVSLLSEKNSE